MDGILGIKTELMVMICGIASMTQGKEEISWMDIQVGMKMAMLTEEASGERIMI